MLNIAKFIKSKKEIIEYTDTTHIYVENIRSFFNLPFKAAKKLCEIAVSHGFFEKQYEVRCPNDGSVLFTADDMNVIPQNIKCQNCELNEVDKYSFDKEELIPEPYYKLI